MNIKINIQKYTLYLAKICMKLSSIDIIPPNLMTL